MARSGFSAAAGSVRPRDARRAAVALRCCGAARCRGGGGARPPRRRVPPLGAGTCVRRAGRAGEEGPAAAGAAEGGGEAGFPLPVPPFGPAGHGQPSGAAVSRRERSPRWGAAGAERGRPAPSRLWKAGESGGRASRFPLPCGVALESKALNTFPSRAPQVSVASTGEKVPGEIDFAVYGAGQGGRRSVRD